jgi:hypothetical protein
MTGAWSEIGSARQRSKAVRKAVAGAGGADAQVMAAAECDQVLCRQEPAEAGGCGVGLRWGCSGGGVDGGEGL